MCKAFSAIVMRDGMVYWKAGMDSHDTLIEHYKLRKLDDTIKLDKLQFARIEIIPDKGYLYPEGSWTLKIDERVKPTWWSESLEDSSYQALNAWKEAIYKSFNLEEVRHPINPLEIKIHKVTKADIANLKKWASARVSVRDSVRVSVWDSVGDSVRDSVGDSVWASVRDSVRDSVRVSVGDSVRDSVWDSVRAYFGSLFPNIKQWEGAPKDIEGYPYQSCVDLWKRGFISSFDGKKWRLHQGKDAKIVYEMEVK